MRSMHCLIFGFVVKLNWFLKKIFYLSKQKMKKNFSNKEKENTFTSKLKNFYCWEKFLNPEEVVSQMNLISGMMVAHFGCSFGYFTFAIAQKLGREGKVYALDILNEKIEKIKKRAQLNGVNNIFAQRANLEEKRGSKLSDEEMDWVIITNILYQNKNKYRILEEAKRIIKKTGRIMLIEWNTKGTPIGPEDEMQISKEEIIKIVRKDALAIIGEIEMSDFHFCLILKK